MRGLNEVLEALLFDAKARNAFLAGDVTQFGLSPEDEDALRTIDHEQLISAATMARKHLMERSHRGVGDVQSTFKESLAGWNGDADDLATAFASSEAVKAYAEHMFAGKGICLEEAFYRFLDERSIGTPDVRRRELAMALLRGLAATPEPTFPVPDMVRRAPKGFYVVLPEGPTLLAILAGKFVSGPITPYLASVLRNEVEPDAKVRAELAKMGLLSDQ